jgi:hypothetical protein
MTANTIRFILVGIVVVTGANVLLSIRDSKMWNQLEQRNEQICQIDPTMCQSK